MRLIESKLVLLSLATATAALFVAAARRPTPTGKFVVGRIVATDDMTVPRFDHTATLLLDGKVLIAGGMARNGLVEPSAELYDPSTKRFTSAGAMRSPRGWGASATLLLDGQVLITGGASGSLCTDCILSTAELYDPASGTFTLVGNMPTPRAGDHTIRLLDGDVLLVGGAPEAALYHAATRTFSVTGGDYSGSATLLTRQQDGNVLALDDSHAAIYDPSTGRFTPVCTVPSTPRSAAAFLPDGRVLFVGGQLQGAWGPLTNTTEFYNPASCSLAAGPSMTFGRFKLGKGIVPLSNGRLLIAGGAPRPEVYDSGSNVFQITSGAPLDCFYFSTATRLKDGRVLIAGGYSHGGGPACNHAWIYQP